MVEVEQRQTKQEIITEGIQATLGGIALLASAIGLSAVNFLNSPFPFSKPDDPYIGPLIEVMMIFGGLFALPYGLTGITAGSMTDSSVKPKVTDVQFAQWLIGGAGIGAAAVATGLLGTISSIGVNDTSTAALWLATVPITGGISRFMWNSAKARLRN